VKGFCGKGGARGSMEENCMGRSPEARERAREIMTNGEKQTRKMRDPKRTSRLKNCPEEKVSNGSISLIKNSSPDLVP
jgi:hypothetical protein